MNGRYCVRFIFRGVALFLLAWLTLAFAPESRASTTFTVNSTIDAVDANPGDGVCASAAGECTLRAAVQETNALVGGDTIYLPVGGYRLTIAGANEDAAATGDLDIFDDLTIQGTRRALTRIDGQGSVTGDRVFHVHEPAEVTLAGVSIRGGRATDGGGIYNAGALTLVRVRVGYNEVTGNGTGGGIYNDGSLTISNSTLSSNSAAGGGGIRNIRGTLTISNSTLSGNSASSSGGGISTLLGTLAISNSTILSNTTGYDGGGIYAFNGKVSISSSILSGNSVVDSGSGGGLSNSSALVTISNSTLSGNSATDGGSIYTYQGPLTIRNSTIMGNSANYGGGIVNLSGEVSISNSTLSSNSAGNSGGGINSEYGTVTISNSTLAGNSADDEGGGIYHYSALVIIRNSTLAGNSAFTSGPNCDGIISSDGYNLLGNNSGCSFNATIGDQVGTASNPIDPLLGILQDNGGPTWTYALLTGSPAIDAGNPAGCTDDQGNLLTVDQRGYLRPVDGDGNGSVVCDIGAYEYGSTP